MSNCSYCHNEQRKAIEKTNGRDERPYYVATSLLSAKRPCSEDEVVIDPFCSGLNSSASGRSNIDNILATLWSLAPGDSTTSTTISSWLILGVWSWIGSGEEFGLDPECLPLAGVRMVDHKAVSLFRESDAVKGEYADA